MKNQGLFRAILWGHAMGYDFVGCEKDAEYFLLQEKRFKNWIAQQSLFEMDGGQPVLC